MRNTEPVERSKCGGGGGGGGGGWDQSRAPRSHSRGVVCCSPPAHTSSAAVGGCAPGTLWSLLAPALIGVFQASVVERAACCGDHGTEIPCLLGWFPGESLSLSTGLSYCPQCPAPRVRWSAIWKRGFDSVPVLKFNVLLIERLNKQLPK